MTTSDIVALIFLLAASICLFLGKRGFRLGITSKESTAYIFFLLGILLGMIGIGIFLSFPSKLT